uniref:Uncharacterized protein n=1 Tax=Auxenochlorella protothecoides TaxID=3075 RepID=A0A1D2A9R3_AUXPR
MEEDDGIDFDDAFFSTIDRLVEAHHHSRSQVSQAVSPSGARAELPLVRSPPPKPRHPAREDSPTAQSHAAAHAVPDPLQGRLQAAEEAARRLQADLERAQWERDDLGRKLAAQQSALAAAAAQAPAIPAGHVATAAASMELQRQIDALRQQLAFKSQEAEELQRVQAQRAERVRVAEAAAAEAGRAELSLRLQLEAAREELASAARRPRGSPGGGGERPAGDTKRRGEVEGGLRKANSLPDPPLHTSWAAEDGEGCVDPESSSPQAGQVPGLLWTLCPTAMQLLVSGGGAAASPPSPGLPALVRRARTVDAAEYAPLAAALTRAVALARPAAAALDCCAAGAARALAAQAAADAAACAHPLTHPRAAALRCRMLAAMLTVGTVVLDLLDGNAPIAADPEAGGLEACVEDLGTRPPGLHLPEFRAAASCAGSSLRGGLSGLGLAAAGMAERVSAVADAADAADADETPAGEAPSPRRVPPAEALLAAAASFLAALVEHTLAAGQGAGPARVLSELLTGGLLARMLAGRAAAPAALSLLGRALLDPELGTALDAALGCSAGGTQDGTGEAAQPGSDPLGPAWLACLDPGGRPAPLIADALGALAALLVAWPPRPEAAAQLVHAGAAPALARVVHAAVLARPANGGGGEGPAGDRADGGAGEGPAVDWGPDARATLAHEALTLLKHLLQHRDLSRAALDSMCLDSDALWRCSLACRHLEERLPLGRGGDGSLPLMDNDGDGDPFLDDEGDAPLLNDVGLPSGEDAGPQNEQRGDTSPHVSWEAPLPSPWMEQGQFDAPSQVATSDTLAALAKSVARRMAHAYSERARG